LRVSGLGAPRRTDFLVETPDNTPLTDADILTMAATRSLLETLGHSPRHPLGQNFLVDPNIVRKSLQLAEISQDQCVVEIGPGLGTLTTGLLAAGAQVWAVEFDPTLFAYLNTRLAPRAAGKLHLMQADAVDFPLAGFPDSAACEQPFKIVANMPYAIATPWMSGVLDQPHLPDQMVLMLQKENAERFMAGPDSKDRGAISVYLEAAYERVPGHNVSRQSFHPAPAVDSVLLNLRRRESRPPFARETKTIIRAFFTQRRKQIGALCRKHPRGELLTRWLTDAAIDPRRRPETLSLDEWKSLDEHLRACVA